MWYADDATTAGKLPSLREWWNRLTTHGPAFGYFANASKTWLITKEDHLPAAQFCFSGTGVNITHEGRTHLGAAIGTQEYTESFVQSKLEKWNTELKSLASTQPHAAYSAFTHGLTSRWTYLARTTPNISTLLEPLETTIRTELLPTLTGRAPPETSNGTFWHSRTDLAALPSSTPPKSLTDNSVLHSSHLSR